MRSEWVAFPHVHCGGRHDRIGNISQDNHSRKNLTCLGNARRAPGKDHSSPPALDPIQRYLFRLSEIMEAGKPVGFNQFKARLSNINDSPGRRQDSAFQMGMIKCITLILKPGNWGVGSLCAVYWVLKWNYKVALPPQFSTWSLFPSYLMPCMNIAKAEEKVEGILLKSQAYMMESCALFRSLLIVYVKGLNTEDLVSNNSAEDQDCNWIMRSFFSSWYFHTSPKCNAFVFQNSDFLLFVPFIIPVHLCYWLLLLF